MFGFQEILDESLSQLEAECETDEDWAKLLESLETIIPESIDEMAESVLKTLIENLPQKLEEARVERQQFEQYLQDFWSEPIDLLEMLVCVSLESGMKFKKKYQDDATTRTDDYVFESLVRLHARACQTSFAILALLKSGFADDAYARWRSLHEIAVIGEFIRKGGQELAERYLLHEPIQQYKLARAQNEVHGRNNEEKIPQQELDALKKRQDKLASRFGAEFMRDYGWAAKSLNDKGPSFRKIEERVRLDHLRPFYRMASDNVHANSHGLYFRMGLDHGERNVLLAGASTAGLADPGHATAISLMQITITLLGTNPNADTITTMTVLSKLVDEIGQTSLKIHKKHEAITPAKPSQENTS